MPRPFRPRRPAGQRHLAAAVGIVLLIAACGGPGPSAAGTIPPVDGAAATPAPTVSAAATAFMARSGTFARGILPFTGSLSGGGNAYRIDGRYEIAGNDWYGIRTLYDDTASPDPTSSASEKLRVGTRAWTRITGGPWIESLAEAARPVTLPGFLVALPPVADAGVEDHAGRPLHRLVLAGGATVPLAVFGLESAAYSKQAISLALWVADDGTPVALGIDASWVGGGIHGEATWTQALEFDLSKLGTAVTVTAPADAWAAQVSDSLGYSLSVPPGYTRTEAAGEDRYALGGTTTLSVRAAPLAAPPSPSASPSGVTELDAAVAAATTEIAKETGAAAEPATDGGLGGYQAMILQWHYGTAPKVYRLDAIAVIGGKEWRVTFIVPAGTTEEEAAQRRTFEQILATFLLAPA